MRFAYPATIEREENGVTVSFEGLPGATWGATEEEALSRAEDLLVTALAACVADGEPIPPPPKAPRGARIVAVPTLEAAKFALHNAILGAGISKVELARRLGMDEKSVRRLLDPMHGSRINLVLSALRMLGSEVILEVRTAA